MHYLGVKLPNGHEAHVNHNGDWSGEARVTWTDECQTQEVTIPCAVLLRVGHSAAHSAILSRLMSALESMTPPEPASSPSTMQYAREQDAHAKAVGIITRYGGTDCAHHKQWVLDQALRALLGEPAYREWVAEAKRDGYEWDEGIAP